MSEILNQDFYKSAYTECLINNSIVKYDACACDSLNEAQDYYGEKLIYIGSGNIYFINGVRNESEKLHHFFIKKGVA